MAARGHRPALRRGHRGGGRRICAAAAGHVHAGVRTGEVLGSLSGGCVEGAVVDAALQTLHDGGSRLESFGYSAEDAFAVGLTCGGELEVHIEPFGSPSGGLQLASLHLLTGTARRPLGTVPRPGGPGRPLPRVALIRRVDAHGGGAVVVPGSGIFRGAFTGTCRAAGRRRIDAVIRGCGRGGSTRRPSCHGGPGAARAASWSLCCAEAGREWSGLRLPRAVPPAAPARRTRDRFPNPSPCSSKAGFPRRACWCSAPTTSARHCSRPRSCWATT